MGQIHCLVISAELWWQGDSFFHSVPTAHSGLWATLDIDDIGDLRSQKI